MRRTLTSFSAGNINEMYRTQLVFLNQAMCVSYRLTAGTGAKC
jgi:hypothetical protein